jgi:hypothetical protein
MLDSLTTRDQHSLKNLCRLLHFFAGFLRLAFFSSFCGFCSSAGFDACAKVLALDGFG